ncbi:MAG: YtpR family tRNA-binding protein [Mycoplasmoidaceae bacterium]
MLNIFYQNKALNDTLIVNVSSGPVSDVQTKENVTIGYCGNAIAFINIAEGSKTAGNNLLKEGLLFPTKQLIEFISSIAQHDVSSYFDNGFKVGLIEQCEDIQGTHLHKCVVSIGDKKLNIVCGAPNARQGLKVVVATNGTMLPSGKQILAGQLLGNKSEGMLCSYRELAIDKESKGIIELDDPYQIGDYFKEVYVNLK